MNPLDLDYDDVGATVVTQAPDGTLHDLRALLIGADWLTAERVERVLGPRGASLYVLPDIGQSTLAEVRGLDPHLVLLPPGTELEHRAEAARRLGWDARLRWAVIDCVPESLDAPEGIDRLLESANLAVAPDREVQANALLADAFGLRLSIDTIGPARLLRALAEGRGNHRVTLSDSVLECRVDVGEGALGAVSFDERRTREDALEGVAALTAFTSLRTARVHVFPVDLACNDLGPVNDALIACASPDLAWVATRVATGRYVQSGSESELEALAVDRDLPDATRGARPSALVARESAPPPAPAEALEMPRPARRSGPPAPVDEVPRRTDVSVQTIVRLEPEVDIDIDVDLEAADDYEEPGSASTVSPIAPFLLTRETDRSLDATPMDASVRTPLGAPPANVLAVEAVDTIRPPTTRSKRRPVWPWALVAAMLLAAGGAAGLVAWTGPGTVVGWVEQRAADIRAEVDRARGDELPAAAAPAGPQPSTPSAVEAP